MEFFSIFTDIWTFALAIFLLCASIFVHELGHFLAAKKRGMKVERFSIGFGPKIYGWTGKDGVEYRLSWIPLGGYVSLPQLADLGQIEGETKTDAKDLPPISYSTKVIVASAGAFFNLLFAFVLATISWAIGQQVAVEEQTNVIGTVRATIQNTEGKTVPGPAYTAGIKAGDAILKVDGHNVATFGQIAESIMLGSGRDSQGQPQTTLTIKRDDQVSDLTLTPAYISMNGDARRSIGIGMASKVGLYEVFPNSAAAQAGLERGDLVTHIDTTPVKSLTTISEYLTQTKEKPVTITYIRDGKTNTITVTPRANTESKEPPYVIGVQPAAMLTPATIHVDPITQVKNVLKLSWRNLTSIFNPRSDVGIKDMSGVVGIVKMIKDTAKYDITGVFVLMILINISLGILNMLPIPVLDGGHILFATIAKLRGRPLPTQFIMAAQSVFMVLLFSLMIYVTYRDGLRIYRENQAAKPVAPAAQQTPAAPAK